MSGAGQAKKQVSFAAAGRTAHESRLARTERERSNQSAAHPRNSTHANRDQGDLVICLLHGRLLRRESNVRGRSLRAQGCAAPGCRRAIKEGWRWDRRDKALHFRGCRTLARKSDGEGTVVYEAANVTPDKDFLLYFTQQDGDFGMNMVAQRESGEDEIGRAHV